MRSSRGSTTGCCQDRQRRNAVGNHHLPLVADTGGRRRGNPAERLRSTASSGHRAILEAMLNEALAAELVCVLRYRRYSIINKGPLVDRVERRFFRHAQAHHEHADELADLLIEPPPPQG